MSTYKEHYWLKLNKAFFECEEISSIERVSRGKDYIIFYMKLLLKSLNSTGNLRFQGIIPYLPEMLAAMTDTEIGTVELAVAKFVELGLMQRLNNNALFMAESKALASQPVAVFKRAACSRERQKNYHTQLGKSNTNAIMTEVNPIKPNNYLLNPLMKIKV